MRYTYKTSGTCASEISFDLENDVVHNVSFKGGCNGNLQGISRLIDGMSGDQVVEKFAGLSCGGRPTSCPDQLASAIRLAKEEQTGREEKSGEE